MPSEYAFTPLPPSRTDATRRPDAVAALSGAWRGRFTDETGSQAGFTLHRDASPDASVAGRFLFFSAPGIAPTGVRLLEANERAFVALIGPYFDPRENGEVITVLEGVRVGGRLEGTFHTRLHRWRETLHAGCFIAHRADTVHRAA